MSLTTTYFFSKVHSKEIKIIVFHFIEKLTDSLTKYFFYVLLKKAKTVKNKFEEAAESNFS